MMSNEVGLSLRERAILVWRQESPMREARRVQWQAEKMESVRQKLQKIIGPEHEIKIGLNHRRDVIAVVEDLRFVTYEYDDDLLHLVPIVTCDVCGKDVSLGFINDMAELGERLEEIELGHRHKCSPI